MLKIRAEQLEAYSQAEVERFREWMAAHLKRFFPRQCKALGDDQLNETIWFGIKRAATYGIKAKRDVCKYIDLVILLGRDFEKDGKLPWASEILNSQNQAHAKLEMLHQVARTHLRDLRSNA
jgi:hypothetical protein